MCHELKLCLCSRPQDRWCNTQSGSTWTSTMRSSFSSELLLAEEPLYNHFLGEKYILNYCSPVNKIASVCNISSQFCFACSDTRVQSCWSGEPRMRSSPQRVSPNLCSYLVLSRFDYYGLIWEHGVSNIAGVQRTSCPTEATTSCWNCCSSGATWKPLKIAKNWHVDICFVQQINRSFSVLIPV